MKKYQIDDLYLAYRKAKAEAFFENTHFHALAFTTYERDLCNNLNSLLVKLNENNPSWFDERKFIGDHAYLPKSVSTAVWDDLNEGHFRALAPFEDWERRFNKSGKKAEAQLRLVIRPTVNFQIVSALWIIHVGHKFDAILDKNLSFGNRLRRSKAPPFHNKSEESLNLKTHGLFAPYFSGYQEWRERGLTSMQESLNKGINVLAITMDLAKFYHRVNPEFIIREDFLKAIKVPLLPAELLFTEQLLAAMKTWYCETPDFKLRPDGAIPVGLSASKIIANVLLAEFDTAMASKIKPIYYGRYVDDVFLVLASQDGDTNAECVGNRLSVALPNMLKIQMELSGPPSLALSLPYAKDSELVFSGSKQKIFILSTDFGADLIHYIRAQIRAQSSEYRLLPAVPRTAQKMATRALLAAPDATLQIDALRKADVVSVRRLGFSLLLSDIETYAADLSPGTWKKIRVEFYALVQRHIITPVGFFDFFTYIPRIFGLMLVCGDFDDAILLIDRLVEATILLSKTTTLGAMKAEFTLCKEQYCLALHEAGIQAGSAHGAVIDEQFLAVLQSIKKLGNFTDLASSIVALKNTVREVMLSDWGRAPYKEYWYSEQDEPEIWPEPIESAIQKKISAIHSVCSNATNLRTPYWPAIAFPTRPLKVDEIPLYIPSVLTDADLFRKAIEVFRGAGLAAQTDLGFTKHSKKTSVSTFVAPGDGSTSVRIAVTSRETTNEQFVKAAKNKHDRSLERYEIFNNLLNKIIREDKRPNYIVMPELSVPILWAIRAARKLAENNISFLCGVEYYVDRKTGDVRNDCLVSLTTKWPGYQTSVVIIQSKFLPAHEEKKQLRGLLVKGKRFYQPKGIGRLPTVFQHNDFFFSILVCSDLMNISHRNELRGEIDALFALEWNRDTKKFSSLVEATAIELHAYIIQVNNRLYGDSRIRAPTTAEYLRDVVQVKGGIVDYYVVGDVMHRALRMEQRKRLSKGDFKQIPMGYRMSTVRKNSDV